MWRLIAAIQSCPASHVSRRDPLPMQPPLPILILERKSFHFLCLRLLPCSPLLPSLSYPPPCHASSSGPNSKRSKSRGEEEKKQASAIDPSLFPPSPSHSASKASIQSFTIYKRFTALDHLRFLLRAFKSTLLCPYQGVLIILGTGRTLVLGVSLKARTGLTRSQTRGVDGEEGTRRRKLKGEDGTDRAQNDPYSSSRSCTLFLPVRGPSDEVDVFAGVQT